MAAPTLAVVIRMADMERTWTTGLYHTISIQRHRIMAIMEEMRFAVRHLTPPHNELINETLVHQR